MLGPRSGCVLAAAAAFAACGGLAPKAGYPWVEDRSLELAFEELLLEVGAQEVAVDARFRFRGSGVEAERELTFPVAAPGGRPQALRAAVEGFGELAAEPAPPGLLPAGRAACTYDIDVPARALGRGDLRVRYRQPSATAFAYTLRTGAYWRGPIGRLEVRVRDDGGRVRAARVEGQPPHGREGTEWRWSFRDLEPRSGVRLDLGPAAGPARAAGEEHS